MTTEQKLAEFVVEELRWEGPSSAVAQASLVDVLDSLAIMKTVSFIEDEFHITLDDEEIVPRNFASVPALAAFVEDKRSS